MRSLSLTIIFTILISTCFIQTIYGQEFLCASIDNYQSNDMTVGTDITTLTDYQTNIASCTDDFGFPLTLTCGDVVDRYVICVTNDIIVTNDDCIIDPITEAPNTQRTDPTCDYKCYVTSTSTFPTTTLPFPNGFDLTTLSTTEQTQIGNCDIIPPIQCETTNDITTPERTILCVNTNNVIMDITLCTSQSSLPPIERIDLPCTNYYCSASPIIETDPTQLDPELVSICTNDNYFTLPTCNPYPITTTRYVGCERNGIIESPCLATNINPTLIPPSTRINEQDINCIYFYRCGNHQDEFVSCNEPSLQTNLCNNEQFPQLEDEKCIPDDSSSSSSSTTTPTGTFERTFITQCVTGLNCYDPTDPEQIFNEAYCTDTYIYQTTTSPCISRDITIPTYQCPCEPQQQYLCAQNSLTLEQLNNDRSLLVDCNNDNLFPDPLSVQGCDDYTSTFYRHVICVDIDGTLSLVESNTINTTPCASSSSSSTTTAITPVVSKDYPGNLQCSYIVKCLAYNETASLATLSTPNCTEFNSILPSPCFSEPQIDSFSIFRQQQEEKEQEEDENNNNQQQSIQYQSEFTQLAYMKQLADEKNEDGTLNFCNSNNARMNQTQGYQYRTQVCIASILETTLDGHSVQRQLDPNLVQFDHTCKSAPNVNTTILPTQTSCCTCKIGYTSGYISEPKLRDSDKIQGDHLNRPWNSYNNCKLCAAYSTMVFPKPPNVLTTLLTGDFNSYNNAIDELGIQIGIENVTLHKYYNEIDFINAKELFLLQFRNAIQKEGGFPLNNLTPVFIEDRFISIVGTESSLYDIQSARRDDYIAVDGDLVLIWTMSGLCSNGDKDSLTETYQPWRVIREDLALPAIASNETDTSLFPFNPLQTIASFFSSTTQSYIQQQEALTQRLQQQQQQQQPHDITSLPMKTLVFDDVFEINGKNQSNLYNTDLFKSYQITNITTQDMYSPACHDYHDCPHGRSPFLREIDDNNTSQSITYLIIILSLICLVLCIIIIIVLITCGSSPTRYSNPSIQNDSQQQKAQYDKKLSTSNETSNSQQQHQPLQSNNTTSDVELEAM